MALASDNIRLVGQRPVKEPRDTAGSAWSCKDDVARLQVVALQGSSLPGTASQDSRLPASFPKALIQTHSMRLLNWSSLPNLLREGSPTASPTWAGAKCANPGRARHSVHDGRCLEAPAAPCGLGASQRVQNSAAGSLRCKKGGAGVRSESRSGRTSWRAAAGWWRPVRLRRGWQIPDAPLKSCAGGMTALKSVSAFQKGFSCLPRPRAKSIPTALGSHRRISPTMKGVAEHSLVFQEQT